MSVRVHTVPAIVCCLTVLTAGGCSKSADEIRAARAANGASQEAAAAIAAAAVAKRPKAVPGDNELVAAVSKDNARFDDDPLFDLRFRLLARPEVSRPLQVELVAVPASDTQFVRLELSVIPGDGISLSGDATFEDRDQATGERVRHTITAMPEQAGVLQLFVSAVAVTDKTALMRQFSVPLIAFGAQPAAPAAATLPAAKR